MKTINRLLILAGIMFLLLQPFKGLSQYVYSDANLQKQLNQARNDVYNEKFGNAVAKYAELVRNNDNKTVSAEYAYALALSGCYDGAIMNLDKIIASGQVDKDVLFYISQVLKLMEYDTIADKFWMFGGDDVSWTVQGKNKTYPPSWISGQYLSFIEKYHYPATINTDDLGTALQRANKLAEHYQYIQSLVLFLEIVDVYPDEYLPCMGLSALLENLGYKKEAAKYLRKGIEKMGKDKYKIDPFGAYEKHLEKLIADNTNDKSILQKPKTKPDASDNKTSKNFTYYGVSYINKSWAINLKYGGSQNIKYLGNFSYSIGLGFYEYDKAKTYTADLALYNVDILIVGFDLSVQFSGGKYSFGFGPCAGLSIPLGRTSIDVLGIFNMNSQEESVGKLSTSVGITHYF